VGLEHVAAALYLAAGVITLAVRADRRQRKLGTAAVISVFAAAGIAVGLEFALDRTGFNALIIYLFYFLIMAVPVTLSLLLRRAEKR
jgi:uncharacterized membrane protein YhiD involved in acid resistance